jgi:DNA-binding XRE family transcriptional regulator
MEEVNSLAQMREQLGLTQKQVADALGVDPRTVLNWENGHHEPRLTIRQVKSLCQLLGKAIDEIPDNFSNGHTKSL